MACVGQFKRGKSTLLNALVGEDVLPVGVPPVTSALTILRHGETAGAQVRFLDGRVTAIGVSEVASYVDERRNPGNDKAVGAVDEVVQRGGVRDDDQRVTRRLFAVSCSRSSSVYSR